MIRAQSGPDNHYMHIVARRSRAVRRPLRAANLDGASVMPVEGLHGSIAKAFLTGVPISIALWVPLVWVMSHIL